MFSYFSSITNRYYSYLHGSAGILARNGGGRGHPRSHSWLQKYEKKMEKSNIFMLFHSVLF